MAESATMNLRSPSVSIPDPRRWWILAVVALSQLMLVLDVTVVNIALPSAQRALHMSDANRQWVITAYTLTFGGFLLLGGRIADFVGRKRTLVVGLIGFATASAIGGAATNVSILLASRATQGLFGALIAPSILSLLTITFSDPKERGKAFGIFGAVAGGGGAIGLVAGGLLTEYLSWRWCLYVNTPIAILAAIGAVRYVTFEIRGNTRSFDIPGALLATAGLVSLVYGFNKAETDGWGSNVTIGFLALAVALLTTFIFKESRTRDPLLPLRIIRDRTRAGTYSGVLIAYIAMYGSFFFLTYYLQVIKGFSPVKSGLAFVPMTATVVINSNIISRLLSRFQPRALIASGLSAMIVGLLWLTQLDAGSSYATHILPALVIMGVGVAWIIVPSMSTATLGVTRQDAGVASAMVNTSQQVGASVGTSLLSTIAASATVGYVSEHSSVGALSSVAVVHGYNVASAWAAAILAVGLFVVVTFVRANRLGAKTVATQTQSQEQTEFKEAVQPVHVG